MLIVVRLTEERLRRLGWRLMQNREFTITVPEHSVRSGRRWRVALLLGDSDRLDWNEDYVEVAAGGSRSVVAIARARRSGRPSTTDDRVSFAESIVLDPPLRLSDLARRVPVKDRSAARDALRRDVSDIDGPLAEVLLDALTTARPELADPLARLRRFQDDPIRGDETPALQLERDAVRLALRIAGFDQDVGTWDPTAAGGYLDRLAYVPREDSLISYDAARFPDWTELPTDRMDWREFADGSHRLRVGNVNATPLERVLGVDLIYRHVDSDTFVLVQYKKMTYSTATGGWGYRPDTQLEAELARMRGVDRGPVAGTNPATWRLYPRGCFVKLVRADIAFDPHSARLLSGIYLPLPYLDEILASGRAVGPRGGTWLSYDTVDRYLITDLFVDLVRQGWIGTRGVTTRAIAQLVEHAIGSGRSVMFAEETGEQEGRERRSRSR